MVRKSIAFGSLFLFVSLSCSAPPPAAKSAGASAPVPSVTDAASSPVAVVPSALLSPSVASAAVVASPAAIFDETILNGKEFLLQPGELGAVKRALDYDLGPLADSGENGATSEATKALTGVLEALSKTTVESEAFVDRWKEQLNRNLAQMLKLKTVWKKWRVGRWNAIADDEWYASFWVETETGRARGIAFVVRRDDRYLLSDVQIDWNELTVKPAPRVDLFDPEALRSNPVIR